MSGPRSPGRAARWRVTAALLLVAAAAVATAAPKTTPDGEVDAQAVARAVATLEHALRAGDLDAGRATLADLEALLPARSLTLLRMQAWFAHRADDDVEAIARYRDVLQRVPGDRNATINLALLEAEQGDVDAASRRLVALRASAGESAELAAAMAHVGATRHGRR